MFIALNVIRIISIIALLLVFASSIAAMVQDVTAWNRFVDAGYKNSISDGNNTMIDISDDYAL